MTKTKKVIEKTTINRTQHIKEVQEMLFEEMNRINDKDFLKYDSEVIKQEFKRSNSLYDLATGYLKTINTSLRMVEILSNDNERTQKIASQLELISNEK